MYADSRASAIGALRANAAVVTDSAARARGTQSSTSSVLTETFAPAFTAVGVKAQMDTVAMRGTQHTVAPAFAVTTRAAPAAVDAVGQSSSVAATPPGARRVARLAPGVPVNAQMGPAKRPKLRAASRKDVCTRREAIAAEFSQPLMLARLRPAARQAVPMQPPVGTAAGHAAAQRTAVHRRGTVRAPGGHAAPRRGSPTVQHALKRHASASPRSTTK